jgi:two-component system, OmpR family, alkaline phosphatase synthesis response regulator PhoP
MARKKVLVVDDDAKVAEVIRLYLNHDGCEVITAYTGVDGLRLAREQSPDLVVLDLLLPELDGWQVCRTLRNESGVPIIMLTARTTEQDRIAGLDLGADDYVPKPFSPRELAARVRAVLRRQPGAVEPAPSAVTLGALKLDFLTRQVLFNGSPISLTSTEFNLLGIMAREPGRVFTRVDLIDKVSGRNTDSLEHTIDTHIMNLRRKLEPDPTNPKYIITVFGAGYKFAVKDSQSG